MKPETIELQEAAKKGVLFNVVASPEDLMPTLMLHSAEDDEFHVFGLQLEDKDQMIRAIRQALSDKQADAYALVVEGWSTSFLDAALARNGNIKDMAPEDRFEVANVLTVEKGDDSPQMSVARIDRLPDGNRRLRKWEEMKNFDGRFAITDW